MGKLREAVLTLINDIESMSCVPDDLMPDSGYWYGEFTEYEENDQASVIVEWPNLSISVALVKEALIAEVEDGGDNGGD